MGLLVSRTVFLVAAFLVPICAFIIDGISRELFWLKLRVAEQ